MAQEYIRSAVSNKAYSSCGIRTIRYYGDSGKQTGYQFLFFRDEHEYKVHMNLEPGNILMELLSIDKDEIDNRAGGV